MASPTNRFPLKLLMGFIGFMAVGLGAMRLGSRLSWRLSLIFTLIVLLIGLLGAIVRRGEGAWVGFAFFGWFAFSFAFLPTIDVNSSVRLDPAAELIDWLAEELHPQIGPGPAFPELNSQFMQMAQALVLPQLETDPKVRALLSPPEAEKFVDFISRWHAYEHIEVRSQERRFYAGIIGHYWFALLFGLIGAVAGRSLSSRPLTMALTTAGRAGLALPTPAPSAGQALPYEN